MRAVAAVISGALGALAVLEAAIAAAVTSSAAG